MAAQKVSNLNLTTGTPLSMFDFSKSTNDQATALAVTSSTVYVGGRFSRIKGQSRTGLTAVDATTGAVDMSFDNQLSGGIGVRGTLTVKQFSLTYWFRDEQNRYLQADGTAGDIYNTFGGTPDVIGAPRRPGPMR